MRKLFIIIFAALTVIVNAQNSQKVAVSAYVADNCGVPEHSRTILQNKLTQLISGLGFAESLNQRFILTAKVDVISEEVIPTTPVMYSYTLNYNLYIGDGISGTLFASTSLEAKGTGNSKYKAYTMALKAVNPRDPNLKAFVADGKQKIVDYYTMNCKAILTRANTLASNQDFDAALWVLSAIPDFCDDCYNQANNMMLTIYQKSIDQDGQRLLAEARAAWSSGLDRYAADRAGAILAQINPQSAAYKEAQMLSKEIADRVMALDSREWAFELQKQKDETNIRMTQIMAARDVSMAWAKNQPKTVYKVYWW